jgi:hypothetical protein
MNNNIHDFNFLMINSFLITFSFTNVETELKIFSLILAIGYTARRWYLMEKNNKE